MAMPRHNPHAAASQRLAIVQSFLAVLGPSALTQERVHTIHDFRISDTRETLAQRTCTKMLLPICCHCVRIERALLHHAYPYRTIEIVYRLFLSHGSSPLPTPDHPGAA